MANYGLSSLSSAQIQQIAAARFPLLKPAVSPPPSSLNPLHEQLYYYISTPKFLPPFPTIYRYGGETCPICYESYFKTSPLMECGFAIKLACHHIFCNICINHWLRYNTTCPLCRDEVGSLHRYTGSKREFMSLLETYNSNVRPLHGQVPSPEHPSEPFKLRLQYLVGINVEWVDWTESPGNRNS